MVKQKNRTHFPFAETIREEFENQLGQLKRFTTHGPSLGRFAEVLLLTVLRKYLPTSIEFATGFVQPMNPEIDLSSPQLDIICFDRTKYPLLFDAGEIKVVPSASVRGIIEVKSTLQKKDLRELLKLTESQTLEEVPATSKIYLLALESRVKPVAAFEAIEEYYDSKPQFNKFLGGMYSLDWREMLVFGTSEKGTKVTYSMGRILVAGLGMSPFISVLISDIFGHKSALAVANRLAPSLYKSLEQKQYTLHTVAGGLLVKTPNCT